MKKALKELKNSATWISRSKKIFYLGLAVSLGLMVYILVNVIITNYMKRDLANNFDEEQYRKLKAELQKISC
jgi:TRAP-type C4-dicarboxylate transport system permease small subunit